MQQSIRSSLLEIGFYAQSFEQHHLEAGRPSRTSMSTSQIKIAINGRFLSQATTGVQRVCIELTKAIDAIASERPSELRVRLICHPSASTDQLGLHSIAIKKVGRFRGHIWEQVSLPASAGDDILLCLGNSAPAYSLLAGNQVAVMIHDLSFLQYPGAYRRSYRLGHSMLLPLIVKRANPLFTVSEAERDSIFKRGVHRPVIVAQNGAWSDDTDVELPSARPERRNEPGYALFVGSFTMRKNIAGVLATAIRLAREDGIHFRFVGSGGAIFSKIPLEIPSDLAGAISFCGQIDDREVLADHYRGARCLIFPSFYEASPMPPLEAMQFGCPVIVSDMASMRERCGDAAEYCNPHDHLSILAAARRVLRDPARAAMLIQRGHERVRRYSWSAQAAKVIAAIEAARATGQGSVGYTRMDRRLF